MRIEVRLFGGLTERVGRARIPVDVPEDITVARLRREIAEEYPDLAPLLDRVKVAVDLEVANDGTLVRGGSEVALLPPVAGGAGTGTRGDVRILTGLRPPPLDLGASVQAIQTPDVGATVTFLGTVRDHAPGVEQVTGLSYSTYPEMAEKQLAEIAGEIADDHPAVRGIALVHALGDLDVGAHTILVVCTAAHRREAFEACSDALERVKDRVPVWKRERLADGTHRWVGLDRPQETRTGR